MNEAYVWTWLALVQACWFICLTLVSLAFFYDGSPLPGNHVCIWVLPIYCLAVPCSVPWSRVSASSAFKKAAASSYPGVIFMQEGYWSRLIFMTVTAVVFPVLWLLVGPNGLLGTWKYHVALMYGPMLFTLFSCFWVYPRCANYIKDSSALEVMRASSRKESRTDMEWHIGEAISHKMITMGKNAQASLSTLFQRSPPIKRSQLRSFKFPRKSESEKSIQVLRMSKSMDDTREIEVDPDFLARADTKAHSQSQNKSHETQRPALIAPDFNPDMSFALAATSSTRVIEVGEASSQDSATTMLLPGTPENGDLAHMGNAGPGPVAESFETAPAKLPGAGREGGPTVRRSTADLFAMSSTAPQSKSGSVGRTNWASAKSGKSLKQMGMDVLRGVFSKRKRGSARKVSPELRRSESDGNENPSLRLSEDIRGRPFIITGHDMSRARKQASMILSSMISSLRAQPFYTATFRQTRNISKVIFGGLWALPGSLWSMAGHFNVAVRLVASDWRMMLARTPQKTIYAAGMLLISPLGWVNITFGDHFNVYVSLAMNCLDLALGFLFFVISCGWMLRADHEMIMTGAEKGQMVGSGLVFSVLELIEALQFDLPLPAGYIATETRVLNCAAISCRWEEVAWELPVRHASIAMINAFLDLGCAKLIHPNLLPNHTIQLNDMSKK
eukprot:scaffold105359_cov44-Prasinocladus_malaysianus.AAC.1